MKFYVLRGLHKLLTKNGCIREINVNGVFFKSYFLLLSKITITNEILQRYVYVWHSIKKSVYFDCFANCIVRFFIIARR